MARETRGNTLVFSEKLIGSFGTFYTAKSQKLDYLMCTINIKNINLLSIQSDVFSFDNVNFDEVIQRNVDMDRIDDQIIKNYLEKNESTIFFPPILVSPILVDEDEKPKSQFDNVEENTYDEMEETKEYIKTWDDAMRLNLLYSNDNNGKHTYRRLDGQDISIVSYASEFLYNSKKLKLVVIDGQHRFLALKRIYENKVERSFADSFFIRTVSR